MSDRGRPQGPPLQIHQHRHRARTITADLGFASGRGYNPTFGARRWDALFVSEGAGMGDDARIRISAEELKDIWPILDPEERIQSFSLLSRVEADEFFLGLSPRGQSTILSGCPQGERRSWLRLLAPDDAVDVLQELPQDTRPELLALLDESTRRDVSALLAYAEDQAGGLMSPRFARVRPTMTVDEAIRYVRRQATVNLETIYYVYVLDAEQHLKGVVSFRELLTAAGDKRVEDIMHRELITVPETMDQEAVARVIAEHDILAVPVLDALGRIRGIVTVDDVVDVVEREATEDIHKLGGLSPAESPYLQTRFFPMLRQRAGWLSILFVGEMFTASAMGRYQDEIEKAVVLALFIPLIISSGGNSGSQASTLVIRAMALGQVRLRDWARIVRREIVSGLTLGVILALIGLVRILVWQGLFQTYGEHYGVIAAAVSVSIVGVVAWGTLSGALLPFILRALGFDPASASAPFVATLVDVFGLVIYFNVAQLMMSGSLL